MNRLQTYFLTGVGSLAALGALHAANAPQDGAMNAAVESSTAAAGPRDVFDAYLTTPFPPADGFDVPEALTAAHGADAPRGPDDVRAVAHGRVVEPTLAGDPREANGAIVLEHVFYENASTRRVRSVYRGLARVDVQVGALVRRGQVIGWGNLGAAPDAGASAFELSWDDVPGAELEPIADAVAFLRARAVLPIPSNEPALLIAHHGSRRLRHYERGQFKGEYGIAFGQVAGAKEARGDLRTPVGMYFVIARSTGPFTGDYADYYGGHWIKVNYPNAFDAHRGLDAGLVTEAQRDAIATAWAARKGTPQKTRLGGGIGLHGWIEPWDAGAGEGAYLSWGCVVLQSEEIKALYPHVRVGTMVVLLE